MTDGQILILMLSLGGLTYLIRFSFLGLMAGRTMAGWVMRLLRFAPVSVLPALVAPTVFFSPASGLDFAPQFLAFVVTVTVGILRRSFVAAFLIGVATLFLLGAILR